MFIGGATRNIVIDEIRKTVVQREDIGTVKIGIVGPFFVNYASAWQTLGEVTVPTGKFWIIRFLQFYILNDTDTNQTDRGIASLDVITAEGGFNLARLEGPLQARINVSWYNQQNIVMFPGDILRVSWLLGDDVVQTAIVVHFAYSEYSV